jgi:hypothetical protein
MTAQHEIVIQCEVAARGILPLLSEQQAIEALDYILRYDEWHIGLEFIIDWLYEDELQISMSQFREFEKAYVLMGLTDDVRLKSLRSLATL